MDTNTRWLKGSLLTIWKPEDKAFWQAQGKAIAEQNLWLSIPALFLAFAIWMVWSLVVTQLPAVGFKYSTDQLSGLPHSQHSPAPPCASSTASWYPLLAGGAGRCCRRSRC